jgi:hypothetical protein
MGRAGAVLRGRVELARLRPGAETRPHRPRPVRSRTAPRHRDRGRAEGGRACPGRGGGRVRGHGSRRRPDDHAADRRRLLGHAPAPWLARGARRHSGRRAGRGRGGRAQRRRVGRAVHLPWSSAHRRATRVSRPAVPPSAPPEPRGRPGSWARAGPGRAGGCRSTTGPAADARRRGFDAGPGSTNGGEAVDPRSAPADAACHAACRDDTLTGHRGGTTGAADAHSRGAPCASNCASAGPRTAAVESADCEAASRTERARLDRDADAAGGTWSSGDPAGSPWARSLASLALRSCARWVCPVRDRSRGSPAS